MSSVDPVATSQAVDLPQEVSQKMAYPTMMAMRETDEMSLGQPQEGEEVEVVVVEADPAFSGSRSG